MTDPWETFKASSDYVELDARFEAVMVGHHVEKAAADESARDDDKPGVVDIEERDSDSVYLTLQMSKTVYENLSHALAWHANGDADGSVQTLSEFTETIVDVLGDFWFGED